MTGPSANGQFACTQGIEHPKFLGDGPGGQIASERAFAFENLLEVKIHDMSLRNCSSKRFHLSANRCRVDGPDDFLHMHASKAYYVWSV